SSSCRPISSRSTLRSTRRWSRRPSSWPTCVRTTACSISSAGSAISRSRSRGGRPSSSASKARRASSRARCTTRGITASRTRASLPQISPSPTGRSTGGSGISSCSIRRAPARRSPCAGSDGRSRAASSTCRATLQRSPATRESSPTRTVIDCARRACSICSRTRTTSRRWRCSRLHDRSDYREASRNGRGMAQEIERKFLVIGDAWRALAARRARMSQGYIASAERASVRVRITGGEAHLNIKVGGLEAVRQEFEYPIPVADGEALLAAAKGPLIEKTRHYVPFEGFEWEVDEFHGANEGLVVAELELDDEHRDFPRPPWVGAEVTHLPRYYNVKLVERPYALWDAAERGA